MSMIPRNVPNLAEVLKKAFQLTYSGIGINTAIKKQMIDYGELRQQSWSKYLLEAWAQKPEIKPHQYQCQQCKGVFDKGWSDEEAKAERERNYPTMTDEQAVIICDDCYKALFN